MRGAEPGFADPEDYDFAILHLTDTQYLAEGAAQSRDPEKRARFQASIDAITDWIAENARRRKIVYAVHTGDVVQNWCWWWDRRATAEREFAVASDMLGELERIGLPYGVLPGNHDNRWGADDQDGGAAPELSLWNSVLGPERRREAAQGWAPSAGDPSQGAAPVTAERGGTWRPTDSSCHYDLLTVGSTRLILLHLGYGVEDEHIDWANAVLQDHADRDAILCTHHFLDQGTRPDGSGAPWGGPGTFGPDDGVRIQERIVARNANVVLVLSGHISGVGWHVDRSDPAHPTTAVLADYQSHRLLEDAQGPSEAEPGERPEPQGERRTGFLRLLQFRVRAGEMRVSTCSPVLDSFDPDAHAPSAQLERLRSGLQEDTATQDPSSIREGGGADDGWADPHHLVLPVSLRSRTTWLQTDRLGADQLPSRTTGSSIAQGAEAMRGAPVVDGSPAAVAPWAARTASMPWGRRSRDCAEEGQVRVRTEPQVVVPESSGAPATSASNRPGPEGAAHESAEPAAEASLTPSQDAHGVVRPDRWAPVLTAAGVLAVGAVVRGLRRR